MDEEFGLTSPFAIPVRISVVPESLLHDLPINTLKLRCRLEKAAHSHISMPIGKSVCETLANNVLDFENQM